MDEDLLKKAKYVLNKMRYLLNNPDDIVSTRYSIDDVLEELGLDSSQDYEELYKRLNYKVNLELGSSCRECMWYSNNYVGSRLNYCRVLDSDVRENHLCKEFRHIDTIG